MKRVVHNSCENSCHRGSCQYYIGCHNNIEQKTKANDEISDTNEKNRDESWIRPFKIDPCNPEQLLHTIAILRLIQVQGEWLHALNLEWRKSDNSSPIAVQCNTKGFKATLQRLFAIPGVVPLYFHYAVTHFPLQRRKKHLAVTRPLISTCSGTRVATTRTHRSRFSIKSDRAKLAEAEDKIPSD